MQTRGRQSVRNRHDFGHPTFSPRSKTIIHMYRRMPQAFFLQMRQIIDSRDLSNPEVSEILFSPAASNYVTIKENVANSPYRYALSLSVHMTCP